MQFDTSLSLELVVTLLAILGAVWRLNHDVDKKIASLRGELKTDNDNFRKEVRDDNANFRKEVRDDIAGLRRDIKALDDKVDAGNQRIARLEGMILSREGLIDAITEAEPTE